VNIEIGQLVDVDLFGLQVAGAFVTDVRSIATVIGLAPGTISLRVHLEGVPPTTEVTVSSGRILGRR
jgi:hypothetical protein